MELLTEQHSAGDRTPYVYYMAWLTEYGTIKTQYIGSRYAKNCHPTDLMVRYHSSSGMVKGMIEIHGEPQIIEIRRILNSPEEAIDWEGSILKRFQVRHNPDWLNSHCNDHVYSPAKQAELWMMTIGVSNPSQAPGVQEKIRQVSMEKRGVEHHLMDPEVIQKREETNLERYGCKIVLQNKDVQEKVKNTFTERYGEGITNPSQIDDVKRKKVETSLRNYGVEYPMQNPEVLSRAMATYKKNHPPKPLVEKGPDKRFDKWTDEKRDMYIRRWNELFGGASAMCSEEVRAKSRETCKERYGVENPSQVPEVKVKAKESTAKTCMEKYGVDYPSKTDERRKAMSEAAKKRNSIIRTCEICGKDLKGPGYYKHIKSCQPQE